LLSDIEELELPVEQPNRLHSWHLYAIRLKLGRLQIDRAEFIAELKRRGIGASVHWMPLHMHPYYGETYGYESEDLPVAASIFDSLVSLPIFPGMTEDQLTAISDAVHEIISKNLKMTQKTHA
jgi:perosamine synthetase